ncbi:uncharacterized protein N7496_000571 [Penicillium cataractarum]|uniref:DUF7137 domain-containing protein n=1 Tax=Penicillium cataractarum TaxID=2100454 RepID=A0A9W9VUE0_9EURO|nr:uncharacterized protein N7496_000571 [Penicillium cataractarum]KAJ5389503.1 hypothetical protein N7496_000571 [Penicillium cataractarum]
MRSFFLSVLYAVLFLGVITSAWPWDGLLAERGDTLDRRADSTTTDAATTGSGTTDATTAASTSSDSSASGTSTGTNTDATTTGTGTGTSTGTSTGTNTKSNTKTKTTATSSISIDPAAGAGGISMITPAATSTTYFKVGYNATFVWNYTSLSVTPSAIDVVASCSLNSQTYTLTQNMSVDPTGTYIWDTDKYQASQTISLLTATYTLFVFDADKSLDDTAEAGYLSGSVGYSFGMYRRESYTPLNEFKCATCSGAISDVQRQGLKFAVGMALITILSFTWFVGGAGLLS